MIVTTLLSAFCALAAPHQAVPGLFPTTSSQQEGAARWYDNVAEAQRVAAKEGKHVLVDFTGTEWCHWCKRLDEEVLSKPEFVAATSDEYVYVLLDFDAEGNARTDRPDPDGNNRLREAFSVSGFPTVVLMTADGTPYASLGYKRGGPEPFAARLEREHARAATLQEIVPKVTAAVAAAKSPEEASAAADDAAKLLVDAGSHSLALPLVPIVRSMLSAPEISLERETAAVTALVAAESIDADLLDRTLRLDPKNAAGLPEAALDAAFNRLEDPEGVVDLIERSERLLRMGPVFDKTRGAHLYGQCAFWSQQWLGDADRARIHARFALSLEPKEMRLRNMLESLSGG